MRRTTSEEGDARSHPSDDSGTSEFAQEPSGTRIIVPDVELPEIMAADKPKADWFSAGEGETQTEVEVDWPAFASPRSDRGEKRELDDEAADRVRYLFPVPDATDWDVGELRVDRRTR